MIGQPSNCLLNITFGCELLVKAFFLKQGYGINKIDRRLVEERSLERPQLPYQLGGISSELLIAVLAS